jgi:hypothetical protein
VNIQVWSAYQVQRNPFLRWQVLRRRHRVYTCRASAKYIIGPAWFIALLRFRDAATQSWGHHCLDLGLIRDGGLIPLIPRWMQYGWS